MKKISIIGSGQVGATAAQRIAEREIADIVLLDIVDGVPQGKALDMMQSAPILGRDINVQGTKDYNDTKNSDMVIITAGVPRNEKMTRSDLLKINAPIVEGVVKNIVTYSPDANIMVVTNPLDIMTYCAYKVSGFDKNRVFGMGGVLDAARFSYFISKYLGVSIKDVNAMVIGSHGNEMVPLPDHTLVSGTPLKQVIKSDAIIDELADRTRKGGQEIIKYLNKGSAYYAPSAAIAYMAEAVLNDEKKIMPVSVHPNGKYGLNDMYVGLPVKVGKKGIEEVIELQLGEKEQKLFTISVKKIREDIKVLKDFMPYL